MKRLLISLWTNEARFIGLCRGLAMALGEAFRQVLIPTGVPGLGPQLGAVLAILAVTVPVGEKQPS